MFEYDYCKKAIEDLAREGLSEEQIDRLLSNSYPPKIFKDCLKQVFSGESKEELTKLQYNSCKESVSCFLKEGISNEESLTKLLCRLYPSSVVERCIAESFKPIEENSCNSAIRNYIKKYGHTKTVAQLKSALIETCQESLVDKAIVEYLSGRIA